MAEAPSNQNRVFIGDVLSSGNSSYLVESVLGQGTFGTVTKCRNIADNKTVAIKMMRNHGSLVEQARSEVGEEMPPKQYDMQRFVTVARVDITSVCGLLCITRWMPC